MTKAAASTKVAEDTMTWLKGTHTVTTGMNFLQADVWLSNQTMAPALQFDVVTGDPAEGIFTTGNFPGAAAKLCECLTARGLKSYYAQNYYRAVKDLEEAQALAPGDLTVQKYLNDARERYEYQRRGTNNGRP